MRQRAVRSDSTRNRERILDAALAALSRDPSATMTAIAQAAGVGRVTLYGHFETRQALVEALFARTVERSDALLGGVALGDDPARALHTLTRSAWRVVDAVHSLLAVAQDELGDDAVRERVEPALGRVRHLIEQGQASGAFRTDQSAQWLTSCYFAIVHGAADDVRTGRLREADAAAWVPDTIDALVAAR